MKTVKTNTIMRYLALSLMFLYFGVVATSQDLNDCISTNTNNLLYENLLSGKLFQPPFYVKGQQYIPDKWERGEIILTDSSIVKDKYLRYYVVDDKLIWLRDVDYKQVSINKEIVTWFSIPTNNGTGKVKFSKKRIKYFAAEDSTDVFIQVLCEGYINLYAFRKAKENAIQKELISDTRYYIEVNNAPINYILPMRRFLYNSVRDKKDLMKQVVRKGHFRVRKENGLISAISAFNKAVAEQK